MTAVLIGQIACAILGYFFVAGLWFSFLSPLKWSFSTRRACSLTWPLQLVCFCIGMPLAIVFRGCAAVVRMVRG